MKQAAYGKLYAEHYDIGTGDAQIVDFYLELWRRLGRPAPVLEPMCGTGLKLIPFLQAGAEGDGLDASSFMLAVCRNKCEAKGLDCTLYEQFVEQMALPRCYGFIFIPDRSFGHIHDKALAAECLRRIHDHLVPGGWLVLDVRPPASIDGFGRPGQALRLPLGLARPVQRAAGRVQLRDILEVVRLARPPELFEGVVGRLGRIE